MDKKRSGGGAGEPALIKNLFRLTCTEEVPFSIYINFHPGMVIITVCPSRCIYLAGRDSNTPEGGYRKSRFFSAASFSGFIQCHRRYGSPVRCLVGAVFRTPVVDLKRCFFRAQPAYSVDQLIIKEPAAVNDIFGINPVI